MLYLLSFLPLICPRWGSHNSKSNLVKLEDRCHPQKRCSLDGWCQWYCRDSRITDSRWYLYQQGLVHNWSTEGAGLTRISSYKVAFFFVCFSFSAISLSRYHFALYKSSSPFLSSHLQRYLITFAVQTAMSPFLRMVADSIASMHQQQEERNAPKAKRNWQARNVCL